MDNIVTEPEDQKQELIHINKAPRGCGYLDWSFKEVREKMDNRKAKQQKEEKRKIQKENNDGHGRIMVTIPYMSGVSEAVEVCDMAMDRGICTQTTCSDPLEGSDCGLARGNPVSIVRLS